MVIIKPKAIALYTTSTREESRQKLLEVQLRLLFHQGEPEGSDPLIKTGIKYCSWSEFQSRSPSPWSTQVFITLLLLLLSHFSRVGLCATP